MNEVRRKIIIFGGNGYLGKRMVQAALAKGVDVLSVSRSGAPSDSSSTDFSKSDATVSWLKGDLSALSDSLREELGKCEGAISCVGAFGSNEFMEKVNGDANISAIEAAKTAGVLRYVYISTVENNLPEFVLKGYFNGKKRTEEAIIEHYGGNGSILRPGFIFGTRQVPIGSATLNLPLWILGRPLQSILSISPMMALRDTVPFMKAILAPPLPVDWVAEVAVRAALGTCTAPKNSDSHCNILSIPDIAAEMEQKP